MPGPGRAGDPPGTGTFRHARQKMRSGCLFCSAVEGRTYVEAPLVANDIESRSMVRPRVHASSQIFHNPTRTLVEAVYVYPLPEGGRGRPWKMVMSGERIVVAEISRTAKDCTRASMNAPRPLARRPGSWERSGPKKHSYTN